MRDSRKKDLFFPFFPRVTDLRGSRIVERKLDLPLPICLLPVVGDGHGARRAGADDPPGCHQGSVADPDREDEV